MRLTDNLHPSIGSWHPSSAPQCDASWSYIRKNHQRTSQCENNRQLEQKWLEPDASTTFLLHLPSPPKSGPRKVFSPRCRIAVFHMVLSLTLSPFDLKSQLLFLSFSLRIRFLRLSLILCHSLLAHSLLRLRLSSSPSQLQKNLLRPSVFRSRPERKIPPRRHKQRYSHSSRARSRSDTTVCCRCAIYETGKKNVHT